MNEHELPEQEDREKSLFARIRLIFKGIGQPKDTREYKVAKIEMQRLAAPFSAIAIPLLIVLVLVVFATAKMISTPNKPPPIWTPSPDPVDPLKPPDPLPQPDSVQNNPTPIPIEGLTIDTPGTPNDSQKTAIRPQVRPTVGPKVPIAADGRGNPDASALGNTSGQPGDMVGTLYDFKRDAKGNPRALNYWEDVKTILSGGFSPQAFSPFYKVERQVYLSHLWVPQQDASIGPKTFGVEDLMEPKGWVAHYQGVVQPQESGWYRLVGHFDDAMFVLIDGKVVLEASWDFVTSDKSVAGWKPKELRNQHPSPSGQYLVYGDWVEFSSERPRRIDLLVGERPGGKIGGLLLIEKRGADYPKAANGRPILPVFLTSTISEKERDRLANAGFQFNMNIPLMDIRARSPAALVGKNEVILQGIDAL